METFSALLAICAGNSPETSEFPAQRPVTRHFDVFFDLRLNERLSKQSRDWWFETPSPHYDVTVMIPNLGTVSGNVNYQQLLPWKNTLLKTPSPKCPPLCSGLNELSLLFSIITFVHLMWCFSFIPYTQESIFSATGADRLHKVISPISRRISAPNRISGAKRKSRVA